MIADGSRVEVAIKLFSIYNKSFLKRYLKESFLESLRQKWLVFLDNNDNGQYLINELEKSLTFRTLLEPSKVYADGVTEWEALDEIKNMQSPNQMLWSLIYRKLKGNRGNTMITIYEAERLCQLIRDKNNRQELNIGNINYHFDQNRQKLL